MKSGRFANVAMWSLKELQISPGQTRKIRDENILHLGRLANINLSHGQVPLCTVVQNVNEIVCGAEILKVTFSFLSF